MWEVEFLTLRPLHIPENTPQTPQQRAGLRHERKVHTLFEDRYPGLYLPNPWIRYRRRPKRPADYRPDWRHCQPDGLVIFPNLGRILIVEAKLCHTPNAWDQIDLYSRVLEIFFPQWNILGCEVVRFLGDRKGKPIRLQRRPEDSEAGKFNVYVLSTHD